MASQHFPPALEQLVEQFAKLPGVGGKSAQRLAFYILSRSEEEVEGFANSLRAAKTQIGCCPVCQNLTQGEDKCALCASDRRDQTTVCVVADPKDVMALERSREYGGVYHVLHGVISPMSRIGPDQLRISDLVARVSSGGIKEVILATNPDTEGEATAMYLTRLLGPFEVKVTRLAYGIPVGSHLEHADDATLMRALAGRLEVFAQ
ncbi:MAG: recombination mediator RecR [Eubacteriales bacterium]